MPDRIMIVDDDPAILQMARTMLADSNYKVHLAHNGPQCLQMLRNGFGGVVLLDTMMPGMDGWDTLAAIHDEGLTDQNVVCLMTARCDNAFRARSIGQHVRHCAVKPFTADKLASVVMGALADLHSPAETI